MVVPVAIKTWNHWNINAPWGVGPGWHSISGCANGGDAMSTGRQMLFNLKEVLKASPGSWEVLSSCGRDENGAAWVYDLTDNWADASWVYFSSLSKRSWIVLRNTAISAVGEGFQMLIDCDNTCIVDTIHWSISSSAGFTTGGFDEENPPTATDQYFIKNNELWTFLGLANQTKGMSVFKTDDGASTRIYGHSGHSVYLSFFFEKLTAADSGWNKPYFVYPGLLPTFQYLHTDSNIKVEWAGLEPANAFMTSEGTGGGSIAKSTVYDQGDVWGNRICTPVGLSILSDAVPSGFLGRVDDLWFVNSNMADGNYYPDDGSRQFVVMGDLLQPSDGSLVHIG